MKRSLWMLAACVISLGTAALVPGQETPADRVSVAFSDPSRPGLLRIGLVHGGITVRGYDGKDVVVEARARARERGDREETRGGLRRIAVTATGLSVEEERNVMRVGSSSHSRPIDMTIQVPARTSLKLSCVNDGDITVEGVQGEIEVSNTNGAVTLTRVSGSVVAHALNEDLRVSFVQIDPQKPMSFSSLNGDIDVTFPPDMRANVSMETNNGDIFSDFDIKLESPPSPPVVEDSRSKGGKFRVRIDKAMFGTINGGGQEIKFKNFNGDIHIRRGAK